METSKTHCSAVFMPRRTRQGTRTNGTFFQYASLNTIIAFSAFSPEFNGFSYHYYLDLSHTQKNSTTSFFQPGNTSKGTFTLNLQQCPS
jgi:hypothetical protein